MTIKNWRFGVLVCLVAGVGFFSLYGAMCAWCHKESQTRTYIKVTRIQETNFVEGIEILRRDCAGARIGFANLPDAFIRNPGWAGRHGPYFDKIPPDVWGVAYKFTVSGSKVRIVSAGPDGKFETKDDIVTEAEIGSGGR